jgi:hypothetical protein
MKEKIFQKLKQEFSHLGLGDVVLQAHADSLAAIGLVTDENINTVVSAQKGFLENLQKTSDKRVTDAAAKAKADAKKELEAEEAKKKAEEEAKRQEEQTKHEREKDMPDWYKVEKEANERTIKELKETNKALLEGFNGIKKENETFKAEKTATERNNLIISKAKELGIPQWRIEEGFSIASDANEEAITSHLTTVANNVKAQLLPGNKNSFPLSDNKPDKNEVDAIAKSLVG